MWQVMNVGMDKEGLKDIEEFGDLEADFPVGCCRWLHCIIGMNLWILWTYLPN